MSGISSCSVTRVCPWAHTYQSAHEVSGTPCLHLHYLEAVKSLPICLSLRGHVVVPLGVTGWLELAGTRRWCLRQRGQWMLACSGRLSQGRVTAVQLNLCYESVEM